MQLTLMARVLSIERVLDAVDPGSIPGCGLIHFGFKRNPRKNMAESGSGHSVQKEISYTKINKSRR